MYHHIQMYLEQLGYDIYELIEWFVFQSYDRDIT